MNRRKLSLLGFLLFTVLIISVVATVYLLGKGNSSSEFFVGVEFAYSSSVNDLKNLVDKVKDYTNLFVIGALEISFNQTLLNEACDYIVNSGLNFIVLFTDSRQYNYSIFDWMRGAEQTYGEKFLGVYRYDEPGGTQLDKGSPTLVENATSYADAASRFAEGLGFIVNYYLDYAPQIFTSDYGLYWFDYESGYSTVFVEFGWNHSRPLHIGLDRGAAETYNKKWGAIITWEYTDAPYIESSEELYEDMVLAYRSGASYVVVFNYPQVEQYGILTEEHFDALKKFWNYFISNSQEQGAYPAEAAYILPQHYGFGFRSPNDSIWGLWNADDLSKKIWDDVNVLFSQYGSSLNVVYDEPSVIGEVKMRYDKLFFWNETIT
jgi:hypothetical protein